MRCVGAPKMFLELLKKLPKEDIEFIARNVLKKNRLDLKGMYDLLRRKINSVRVRRYVLFFSRLRGLVTQEFLMFKSFREIGLRSLCRLLGLSYVDVLPVARKYDDNISHAWYLSERRIPSKPTQVRDGLVLRYDKLMVLLISKANGPLSDSLIESGISQQRFPPYLMRELLKMKANFTRLVFLTRREITGVWGVDRIILEGENVLTGFYELIKRQDRFKREVSLFGPLVEIEVEGNVAISSSGIIRAKSLESLLRILPSIREVISKHEASSQR